MNGSSGLSSQIEKKHPNVISITAREVKKADYGQGESGVRTNRSK